MIFQALMFSALAWLIGLFADANLADSFLMLRLLLPMLTLGYFILRAVNEKKS